MSIALRRNTQTLWTWLWARCAWGAAATPLHALASNSEQHVLLRVTKASLAITQLRVCVCSGGRVRGGRRGMAQWWVSARSSLIARLAGCAFVRLLRWLHCWAWPHSWQWLLSTCLANRLGVGTLLSLFVGSHSGGLDGGVLMDLARAEMRCRRICAAACARLGVLHIHLCSSVAECRLHM